jgi:prevent-host-death family protein
LGSAVLLRISVVEAQDRLDELVDRVEAGEEVELTENDRAVVRLVRVESADMPSSASDVATPGLSPTNG